MSVVIASINKLINFFGRNNDLIIPLVSSLGLHDLLKVGGTARGYSFSALHSLNAFMLVRRWGSLNITRGICE